jgi:hypothetical protein
MMARMPSESSCKEGRAGAGRSGGHSEESSSLLSDGGDGGGNGGGGCGV